MTDTTESDIVKNGSEWRYIPAIFIIKCPDVLDFDLELGQRRTQSDVLQPFLKLHGLTHVWVEQVSSKTELEKAIKKIEKGDIHEIVLKNSCYYPILHFCMHGTTNGIFFPPDKPPDPPSVTWKELGNLMNNLFNRYHEKIIICLSVCEGFNPNKFSRKLATSPNNLISEYPLPFKYLVGTTEKVPWVDATIGFLTFYHYLLRSPDETATYDVIINDHKIEEAVSAMKAASQHNSFDWISGNKELSNQ